MTKLRNLGAMALALLSVAFASYWSLGASPAIMPYVLVISLGSALITALLWRGASLHWGAVIGFAALLHIVALTGAPAFEDDHFRFIWDGWQTLRLGTPYGVPPADYFIDETVPGELLGILDGVNNPDLPTIYGPSLQVFFAFVTYLAGPDLFGLRVFFALANLALIGLMLRKFAPERVALFAWNPLVIVELVIHSHPDGIMALALFPAVMLLRKRPALAGFLLALAAGAKIVALAAWPILLRTRPIALITAIATLAGLYGIFLIQGGGAGFETTAVFARIWHFNPFAYEILHWVMPPDPARLVAAAIAGLGVVWLHTRYEANPDQTLTAIFGVVLLFASAVNPWYLVWLLPFAVGGRQIWPFAATVALPFSYFTGLNLEIESIQPYDIVVWARLIEAAILIGAIAWDIRQARRRAASKQSKRTLDPIADPNICIVIPALNEEQSVGSVVRGLLDSGMAGINQVRVVDNGSTDRTAQVAVEAGAVVIAQPERGYGAACLAGLADLPEGTNIVLFADADGSDVPSDAVRLVECVANGNAALAIGSRTLGTTEAGAMTMPQRFGNWLAPALMRLIWRTIFTDLGPLRAIRRDALDQLAMEDRDFGWTIEMQVKAAKSQLICVELPADYRKRIGVSKISGTLNGVLKAGTKIILVVFWQAFGDFGRSQKDTRALK
ncbi:MAG: glycosyltransferase family 2 protein [Erythrobacter sp.]